MITRAQALADLKVLQRATVDCALPLGDAVVQEYGKDPYLLLISCLLSLRAKDTKTLVVVRALFQKVRTPRQLCALSVQELERIIYSIGFYKQKARTLRAVSVQLIERFDARVPRTQEELLSLLGVGRKTANLVLGMAFDIPAVCVDVHVHRIANLLDFVHTKTPEQTEFALEKLLPRSWWIKINRILVQVGQNVKKVLPRLPRQLQQKLLPLVHRKPAKL